MLNADALTLREFIMRESLPLSTIHEAVFEFLRNRDDAVVFGAQAVNAYVDEPRMTQDVDLMSTRAADLAEELRQHLNELFHVAIRLREIGDGKGYRLYQVQKTGNRHLVDLRPVTTLPLANRIGQILVMAPAELIASKVISYYQRRGKPKSGTDWRDLALLLLQFPELKSESSLVTACLKEAGASDAHLEVWQELIDTPITIEDEEDEF
jgi:hypothetical protein